MGDSRLELDVVAGEPVRIALLDIVLSGDASEDEDFLALIYQTELKRGAVLNHQAYDLLKSKLLSIAQRKGYFEAQFSTSRMEVIPALKVANIQLHFNSGSRYKFGAITFHNNQIDEPRSSNLKGFEWGQLMTLTLYWNIKRDSLKQGGTKK